MLAQVPLWPEQASTVAPRVDAVTGLLLAVSGFFTLLIFTLIIYFAIKYRRRSPTEVPPKTVASMKLEIGWTVVPLFIVLGIYVAGTRVYFEIVHPPDNAMEVFVVGKQWMWYTQHGSGQRENQGLTVPLGVPVKLTMTSQDVIHDFAIPAFRVRQDVVPGRYSTLWFTATKTGKFHLFCAEYCGTNHSRMVGWITVLEPNKFQDWLNSTKVDGSPATEGRKLFQKLQCVTCHSADARARAPVLENLYGTVVPLEDGRKVRADEDYIRESILDPPAKVVAGFKPIMPSFKGQVTETQLIQLVAFIKSLRQGETPKRNETADRPAAEAVEQKAKKR
jgi:cytochrome c oxidase subunit 2